MAIILKILVISMDCMMSFETNLSGQLLALEEIARDHYKL